MTSTLDRPDRVRVWRPAGLDGTEVVHAEDVRTVRTHLLDRYCVAANPRDDFTACYRGRSWQGTGGMVQFGEPGEVVRILRQATPARERFVFLDPAAVDAACRDLGLRPGPRFRQTSVRDDAVYAAFDRLHHAVLADAPRLALAGALAEALALALREHADDGLGDDFPDPAPEAVRRARDYLHAHWADDVALDDLAVAGGVSKFHLARRFREAVGLPPHAYLVRLRLARARDLIARGWPLAAVAHACGFAAQSHLHRHFARVHGMTPGAYAAAVRSSRPTAGRRSTDRIASGA